MRLDEGSRVLIINAIVLALIVLLIITMPRDLFEEEPPDDPPETPSSIAAAASTGEESLLVLLSEYNFDHTPRFSARIAPEVGLCGAIPFIDPERCEPPIEELAFAFENETSSGILGYAVMSDPNTARSLMSRYSRLTESKDGTYLSVTPSLSSITDHALLDKPDDSLVFYHPVGVRFEHAWIVRFDQLLIYGYEHTPERTITRKFTHSFDREARSRVLERYNLTHQGLGDGR